MKVEMKIVDGETIFVIQDFAFGDELEVKNEARSIGLYNLARYAYGLQETLEGEYNTVAETKRHFGFPDDRNLTTCLYEYKENTDKERVVNQINCKAYDDARRDYLNLRGRIYDVLGDRS